MGSGCVPPRGRAGGWRGTPRGVTGVTPRCSGCLGGELWRWLSAYTCGLVCVASVLAGTAGVLWMREEGRRRRGGLEHGAVLCRPSFTPCGGRHGKVTLALQTIRGEDLVGEVESHGGIREEGSAPEREGHAAGGQPSQSGTALPRV